MSKHIPRNFIVNTYQAVTAILFSIECLHLACAAHLCVLYDSQKITISLSNGDYNLLPFQNFYYNFTSLSVLIKLLSITFTCDIPLCVN